MASVLRKCLQSVDPSGDFDAYRLWSFWDEVVGPGIARRAQPRLVRRGILHVGVSSHAWMQELEFHKEEIRARLNERLGAPLVEKIVFRLDSAPWPEPAGEKPETPRKPVPMPELPPTGDEELDAALARVARAYARKKASSEDEDGP
ncbi:MAG: hypothetical protein KatS3mg076_2634 [Candidatus Binatia bacterium]|nr:MAG: hypothetical protein KatS3mg076_2634 [Candidatus Binatia bacterium]